ncbi:MAG: TorF family putative porin, partial [Pseudoxanthomonas sp.]
MTLLRLLAFLASASPALAQAGESDKPFHWSNGAAISTEYVWRGQSLTDGKPAIVGELKISHGNGLYAGIWAGSLDLGPGTDTRAEFDYFLGWNKRYGKVYVNTGYLYRLRPSDTLELD